MLPLCTVCRLVGLLISDIHCAWRCSVSVQVENLVWKTKTARSLRTRDLRNISYVAFLPSPLTGNKCFQSSGVFLGCQKFTNNHFNQLSRRNKDWTQHHIIHLRALFYTTNSRARIFNIPLRACIKIIIPILPRTSMDHTAFSRDPTFGSQQSLHMGQSWFCRY